MSTREPPNPDDPTQHYLDYLKRSGSETKTIKTAKTGLIAFNEFLDELGKSHDEVTDLDCLDFIQETQEICSNTTTLNYAGSVSRFYDYFSRRGTFDVNPMALALEESNLEPDTSNNRREISVQEMALAIQNANFSRLLVMLVILAKTGMRAGELCNLDLSDFHLTHPRAQKWMPEPRPEIQDRPSSVFVSSEISEDDIVRGERRKESNKRKRDTIIPIDEETERVIVYYLASRMPSDSPAEPFLTVDTHPGRSDLEYGDRVTSDAVRGPIQRWAEEQGWYQKGGGAENNVTPHYFRHFFTTHMRERTGERSFVKFIRGDKGDDIIETYTHNWGDKVRKTYLKNIYTFFD